MTVYAKTLHLGLSQAQRRTDTVDVQAGFKQGSSLLQDQHMYCQQHLKCPADVLPTAPEVCSTCTANST